jgi:holo-[acyl-carrier protein] synthase
MIVGIGIDIVELERIAALMERQEHAVQRLLTEAEQKLLASKRGLSRIEFLAGRFAAKEAASKALGTGIGGTVGFLDMEVVTTERGKPEMKIRPHVLQKLELDPERTRIHLSISHSRTHAIAQVIVEV